MSAHGTPTPPPSGQPDREPALDPILTRALSELPEEPARAAFRAGLKQRFLEAEGAAPVASRQEARRAQDAPAAAPRPSRIWPWLLASAAAAVAWLALGRDWRPSHSGWDVLPSSSGERVYVDGREHAPGWERELSRALAAGARVRTPAGTSIDLRLGDVLALTIGPDSEIELPAARSTGAPGALHLTNHRGHLAVVTGERFEGRGLTIASPDGEARVVGTSFAVDVDDGGTCVCCTEGRVEFLAANLPANTVEAQRGLYVTRDAHVKTMPAMPPHVAPLAGLAEVLGRGAPAGPAGH